LQKKGILSGVRVLDLTRMLSGPYSTMVLADHGAEVIKIEDENGDTSRFNGPYEDADKEKKWAGYFISLNRNKKSVQLDLKTVSGKQIFRDLVRSADILIENFRPGVMERLDLSFESLQTINPKLVYGAIRGFGDPRSGGSPYMDWPSYDVVAQAMGGVINLTGESFGKVVKVGPGVGDIFSGLFLSFGVIAALRDAESTGKGQFVDISMYDAMISLCERAVYQYDIEGQIPGAGGNSHPFLAPFGIFPASDGKVAIGVVEDRFWVELVNAIGSPPFVKHPKFSTLLARKKNLKEVNKLVASWTTAFSKQELLARLGGIVPFGPVNNIKDIINDPHTIERNMISKLSKPDSPAESWLVASNPLNFNLSPKPKLTSPPRLGEHNSDYFPKKEKEPDAQMSHSKLRAAFGNFTTGITIITTLQADGIPRGFTANSFTSVSLDPPLLLVCVAKNALSHQVFMEAKSFAINVLTKDQESVSTLFSTQSENKFLSDKWDSGKKNMPILRGSLSNFVCHKDKVIDAGDHTILIGRVIEFMTTEGEPLLYFKGNYVSK
jgi:crotonobetainyl-CoA:carnitine CoA-transferase CaiB-like acyl-CoA transferase/flavin reductase (DIM6/NTAB) family NADH-FMN oxidoreductase RutF